MQIINKNQKSIAIIGRTARVHSVQDALDLMATARYHGDIDSLVFHQESLHDDFFDLKTRFAGEILQKFSNYRVRSAIVGDFSQYKSKALQDFIYECNNGQQVFWVSSLEAALDKLAADD